MDLGVPDQCIVWRVPTACSNGLSLECFLVGHQKGNLSQFEARIGMVPGGPRYQYLGMPLLLTIVP